MSIEENQLNELIEELKKKLEETKVYLLSFPRWHSAFWAILIYISFL